MAGTIGAVAAAALMAAALEPAPFPLETLLKDHDAARTFDYWRLREGRTPAAVKALGDTVTKSSRNGACQTDAEREIVKGLATAAEASTGAQWRADRAAGADAVVAYDRAKAAMLAGRPSDKPALEADMAQDLKNWRDAPTPRARALLQRQVQDQLPMRAMLQAFGDDTLAPGAVARLTAVLEQEECRNSHALSGWLKADVARNGWFVQSRHGKPAAKAAWLITQHADHDIAFQKDVLRRLERLLPSGDLNRADYGYLWDRVAVNEGRPQRYGTQTKGCIAGKVTYQPIEDPDHVDARRASLGMDTLAAYGAALASITRCHA